MLGIEPTTLATTVGGRVSRELAELADRTRAAVVEVSDGRGGGAGTIWSSDGLIVTNYHVVPGETAQVATADGQTLTGAVVTNLPDRDLAILRVEAHGLPFLHAADVTALRPGELLMAVGHPLGVTGAVTLGVFSGVGSIEQRQGRHFSEAILANIELRPGNSGGPLVNVRGELVGINSMVLGPGTALAVPVIAVERIVNATARRTLGVRGGMVTVPADWAVASGQRGQAVMTMEVVPDSAASRAGLLPGDLLLTINGQRIEEPGDIAWALAGVDSATIEIGILRGGQPLIVDIAIE